MDEDRLNNERKMALKQTIRELLENPTQDAATRVRARFVVAAKLHISHDDAIDALFDVMAAVQAMVGAVNTGRADAILELATTLVRVLEEVFEPVSAIVDSIYGIKNDERK